MNGITAQGSSIITPLVKHVLSRELQLYFTRLTEALGTTGGGSEMREAALGSVRSDPGLHQLVPYLVGWGGEQVSARWREERTALMLAAARLRTTWTTWERLNAHWTSSTRC